MISGTVDPTGHSQGTERVSTAYGRREEYRDGGRVPVPDPSVVYPVNFLTGFQGGPLLGPRRT